MPASDFREWYPTATQVDDWVESIWALADGARWTVARTPHARARRARSAGDVSFIRYDVAGLGEFHALWHPSGLDRAPLAVQLPGYWPIGWKPAPDLVRMGLNVLCVSPLGYSTPEGVDRSKLRDGDFPVLDDTVRTRGCAGYRVWLAECAIAVSWATQQPGVDPGRLGFFGTSQGGSCALLAASLFRERGVRCAAASQPYLTDLADRYDAMPRLKRAIGDTPPEQAWHTLGLVDSISHAHRLHVPVLLTAGSDDRTVPAKGVEAMYEALTCTRSYTLEVGVAHTRSQAFRRLAAAWLRTYC